MAVPVYSEDLTDVDLAESTTGWAALGGGGAGLGVGADFSMQGTNCVDKQITNTEKGQVFDNGAGIAMGAGVHQFVWVFLATAGLAATLANRGLAIVVGSSTTAYCQYHVEGSDTYGAAGRVGRCYPIDYSLRTSNIGSAPYRTLTGSPTANPRVWGSTANITGTVKGANLGVDAIRYGTGAYITAGDSGTPATFQGFSTQNDSVNNRWGILTQVGAGFELQGKFVIGQNNSKVATLAYFSDTDKTLSIVDTPHAASNFTQIIVDHASTTCILTNITIATLGTVNKGQFIVNTANPTVTITGGTWTGFGITTLRSNTTVDGLTLRLAGQLTQNSATLTNCLIDRSYATSSILTTNPTLITDSTFISSGTGHAVECTATGTFSWTGNTDSGYTGTRGSNLVASSGSANAMFYNNSGGAITLNVGGGGQSPSVRNAAGSTTTVVASFTLTLTDIPTGVNVTIVNSSTRTELQHSTSTGANITYAHQGGEVVDILLMANNIDPNLSDIFSLTLPTTDSSIKFQVITDVNYSNP